MDLLCSKVIFVDCFDTIVHRREHPFQVIKRWARCVSRLYPELSQEMLYRDRMAFAYGVRVNIELEGIDAVYEDLTKHYVMNHVVEECKEIQLKNDMINIEVECEIAVADIDSNMFELLKRQKVLGKKIYLLLDFHFHKQSMIQYLKRLGLINFFDDIFVSSDYGVSKAGGELYRTIIEKLKVKAEDCVMVGDNKKSDVINARSNGVKSIHVPHKIRKFVLRVKNKLGITYNPNVKDIGCELQKNGDMYEEYALIFYTFCARLHHRVNAVGYKKVVFLAREGYFLKDLFEKYQKLCIPREQWMKTEYLKCSRRAINSVQSRCCDINNFSNISIRNYFRSVGFSDADINKFSFLNGVDKEKVIIQFPFSEIGKVIKEDAQIQKVINDRIANNKCAFEKYVKDIVLDDSYICLVDVGWKGSMQLGISKILRDVTTTGFYLGIYDEPEKNTSIQREGLIFNKNFDGKCSKYFGVFRANTQLYEQLLSAPHGSACYYELVNDIVNIYEDWNIAEKRVYCSVIKKAQQNISRAFEKICILMRDDVFSEIYDYRLACIKLKSDMLQSDKRLSFVNQLRGGFVWNFQQETVGLDYANRPNLHFHDMIFHPENYVRYFCKIRLILTEKIGIGIVSKLVSYFVYCYVRFRLLVVWWI